MLYNSLFVCNTVYRKGVVMNLLETYLEQKKLAWSDTTYKNEEARLTKHASDLKGNAYAFYQELEGKGLKRYTLVSIWNRVIEMWDLKDKENNPYRRFKKKNARLFKNFYNRKLVEVTFDEAKKRISSIPDKEVRDKAMDLLHTGLRYRESQTESDGLVIGKGSKARKVFRPSSLEPVKFSRHYTTFTRHLKRVGLTSHMLRKLAATRLVDLGFKEQDLCKVFGWNSFETAKWYLQPKQDAEINNIMEKL